MIVKNEEKVLERCLLSTKNLFDEIIIVDTGSTDKTKEIAHKFTNKVFSFEWCDNFSKARNFAFSKATSSYIMWLDADDIIPNKTLPKLLELKNNLSADTYMLRYDISFVNNKPTFSYFRERIIKKSPKAIWCGAVHECITPFGEVVYLPYSIEHRKIEVQKNSGDRNIKIYRKESRQRELNSRELYYYGRELFDHKKYYKCISVLKKFVAKKDAWVENVIDALYIISNCYNKIGKQGKQFEYLTKTFAFDTPCANICCSLGDYFLINNKIEIAIFWYKTASNAKDISTKGGFVENMYYNYYPYIQLCLCYYKLGDNFMAEKYNKKAKEYYYSPAVKYNEIYFNSLKNAKNN